MCDPALGLSGRAVLAVTRSGGTSSGAAQWRSDTWRSGAVPFVTDAVNGRVLPKVPGVSGARCVASVLLYLIMAGAESQEEICGQFRGGLGTSMGVLRPGCW